ncbi:hypothetical protein GCM10017322_23070 [Paracoccus aerius]|nr:hypothetical protein GCM10017322_23070 [Paracoccus aerius]
MSFMTDADKLAADNLNPARGTVRRIAREVCEYTDTRLEAVMGRDQTPATCRVRELVCYIAERSGLSPNQISRALGKDGSTVRHAIQNEKRRRGEA